MTRVATYVLGVGTLAFAVLRGNLGGAVVMALAIGAVVGHDLARWRARRRDPQGD